MIDQMTPRIGMGCWAIGGQMWTADGKAVGYGRSDDSDALRTVAAALELGIRVFDTAAAYGTGHSETLLGQALKGRDDAIVVTKFGITIDPPNRRILGQTRDPARVMAEVEASLRRLNRDRIDLLLLHDNTLSPEAAEGMFDALSPLQNSGKIAAIGWSTDFPDSVRAMAGRAGFGAIQHAANVFVDTPTLSGLCQDLGLWALNRSPLAMGVLTAKFADTDELPADDVRGSGQSWNDYFTKGRVSPDLTRQLAAVKELLCVDGRTPAQGALCWLLARSPRNLPIPGARSVAQITENAGALDHGPLPASIMAEIEAVLDRPPEGPPRER